MKTALKAADILLPFAALAMLAIVYWRDEGYITAALTLFFCIWIELRQLRQTLGGSLHLELHQGESK